MAFVLIQENGAYVWVSDHVADLDMNAVNNFAEYGQPYSPYFDKDSFMGLPWDGTVTVRFPNIDVMTNGYGRSITASQFPAVQRWMNGEIGPSNGDGLYSINELDGSLISPSERVIRFDWLSYLGLLDRGDIGWMEQKYVHGTVAFRLMDGTIFGVEGSRRWVVAEMGARHDNFDFTSDFVPPEVEVLVFLALGPSNNNLAEPMDIEFVGSGRVEFLGTEPPKCFAKGTAVSLWGGKSKPIEAILAGDRVVAFGDTVSRGELSCGAVTRVFTGVTEEWLVLSDGLVVTPGHHFLGADGRFRAIADILTTDSLIVLKDGSVTHVAGEYVRYSQETAHLYEQAEGWVFESDGATALAPVWKKGWKTYNFEVEDFHTYIAGGVRVHNDSLDIASGKHVKVGTTWTINDVTYLVKPDGSVVDAETGRITSPATVFPGAALSNLLQHMQMADGSPSGSASRPFQIDGNGPSVTLASGTASAAGTFFSPGNGYTYVVNGDGSVTNLDTSSTTPSPNGLSSSNSSTYPNAIDFLPPSVQEYLQEEYGAGAEQAADEMSASPVVLDLNGDGISIATTARRSRADRIATTRCAMESNPC